MNWIQRCVTYRNKNYTSGWNVNIREVAPGFKMEEGSSTVSEKSCKMAREEGTELQKCNLSLKQDDATCEKPFGILSAIFIIISLTAYLVDTLTGILHRCTHADNWISVYSSQWVIMTSLLSCLVFWLLHRCHIHLCTIYWVSHPCASYLSVYSYVLTERSTLVSSVGCSRQFCQWHTSQFSKSALCFMLKVFSCQTNPVWLV